MVWRGLFQVALSIMRFVTGSAVSNVNNADGPEELRGALLRANTTDIVHIAFWGLAVVAAWAVVRAIAERQEETHKKQLAADVIAVPS